MTHWRRRSSSDNSTAKRKIARPRGPRGGIGSEAQRLSSKIGGKREIELARPVPSSSLSSIEDTILYSTILYNRITGSPPARLPRGSGSGGSGDRGGGVGVGRRVPVN